MRLILIQISDALRNVIKTFFASDLEVMSDEVREILSNPEDAEKYIDAVKKIEKDNLPSVTITLSNKRELTLVQ